MSERKDEDEQVVSLLEEAPRPSDAAGLSSCSPRIVTALYCSTMAINGGMVGAFGPSLETFHRTTHLSPGQLGTAVLANRLAKLFGTVLWAWYAERISASAARGALSAPLMLRPHAAMAVGLATSAASCAVIGFTTSADALRFVVAASGVPYGFTDSACIMLTLWLWRSDAGRQRGAVAVVNVFFTGGAFVTPILVAASLHYLEATVWPAFHTLAAAAILAAAALSCTPSPAPERKSSAASRSTAELDAVSSESEPSELLPKGQSRAGVASTGDSGGGDEGYGDEGGGTPDARGKLGEEEARLGGASPDSRGGSRASLGGSLGGSEGRRAAVLIAAAGVIGFFANGCEHTAATWLSPYGVRWCGLADERMAVMTSNYWTSMSAGRVAWAVGSSFVKSAWPVLLLNIALCSIGSLLFCSTSEGALLAAALSLGVGVSSIFPALVSLPAELRVEMTPQRLAVLQLMASAGEMLCPFAVGILFQMRMYSSFGPALTGMQAVAFTALATAFFVFRTPQPSYRPIRPADAVFH
mmetsp:Transcript_27395/g.88033  ORF Transcript_27395/g.88033 Transcript_27395/m.88033 type:complete len:528 (-) Transcript_27395:192-1775(-)